MSTNYKIFVLKLFLLSVALTGTGTISLAVRKITLIKENNTQKRVITESNQKYTKGLLSYCHSNGGGAGHKLRSSVYQQTR